MFEHDETHHCRIYDCGKHGKLIAEVGNAEDWTRAFPEWEANSAYIVKACNAHPELVAALREIGALLIGAHDGAPIPRVRDICQSALERAGEGELEHYDGVFG
jgi:hypothetical protein